MTAKGRPRKSCVWSYFDYIENEERSVCLVKLNETNCGHSVKGKFPTNLKTHLKSKHPEEFRELQRRESEKKYEEMMKQERLEAIQFPIGAEPILGDMVLADVKYSLDSERHRAITKELAVFLVSTNTPISVVENESFKRLLQVLDDRYRIPDHNEMEKEITFTITKLKEVLISLLQGARFVNICASTWTEQTKSASFVKILAHFYSRTDSKRHDLTLAIHRLPLPYSAADIAGLVRSTLTEWQIAESTIHRIVSDNGSNMMNDYKWAVVKRKDDSSCEEEEMIDDCNSSITADWSNDQESSDKDEQAPLLQNDVDIFDDNCEVDHAVAFIGFKRSRCFSYTLQLVLQVFDRMLPQNVLLKKIYNFILKVSKSKEATDKLIKTTGRKLICCSSTRWSNAYLVLNRLLVMKKELSAILEELQWDNLPDSFWKQIKNIVVLLQPFAQYMKLTGSEETGISMVIPVHMELQLHLEQMKGVQELAQVAVAMQRELEKQFENIVDPHITNFDPLFVTCTFLHPGYRDVLSNEQQAAAKSQLVKWITPSLPQPQLQEETTVYLLSVTADIEEPSPKRLKLVNEMLSERRKASIVRKSTWSLDLELKKYSESDYVDSADNDPFIFWKEKEQIYPLLAEAAFDLLSTPVSAVEATELLCSNGSEPNSVKYNTLTDSKLQREILFQNKKYLPLIA